MLQLNREIFMSGTTEARSRHSVELRNEGFLARNLDPDHSDDLDRIHQFRHRVFSQELGWVAGPRETDEYDQHSVHFAAFSPAGDVVACSRFILPSGTFMLETEFTDLVEPGYQVRKEADTVEASRFAVSADLRRTKEGFAVTELLCSTMCLWARRNAIRYCYLVLDNNYVDFLQRFFPVSVIGPTKVYDSGLTSAAVIFDMAEFGLDEANALWDSLGRTAKPSR
jgi:N-acyl-L-homoserine lactone synthetase